VLGILYSNPRQDLNHVTLFRLQFGKLGEMIAARTRLKEHSRFLFIPGPDDAGTSNTQ
jgi:hypothetical protein